MVNGNKKSSKFEVFGLIGSKNELVKQTLIKMRMNICVWGLFRKTELRMSWKDPKGDDELISDGLNLPKMTKKHWYSILESKRFSEKTRLFTKIVKMNTDPQCAPARMRIGTS